MELWDVYDVDGKPKGCTHVRGEALAEGDYHLAVHVWHAASDGRFLLTRRAPCKEWPLLWECSAGSAIAGEDGLAAAVREAREETGLALDPAGGTRIAEFVQEDARVEVWAFVDPFEPGDIRLQPEETVEARLATLDEIEALLASGEMVPDFAYFPGLARFMEASPKGAPWKRG